MRYERDHRLIGFLVNASHEYPSEIFGDPIHGSSSYLAGFFGFFGFFLAAGLCGDGGVPSIRRNTSSGLGDDLCSCFMAGF